MLSILTYLIIAGMLILLVFMSFETKSGGDAATRGLGKFLILLPVAAIVFLVGQWPCCEILLKNGANPNYKNKDGISIKDYILQKAENSKDDGYYKNPDFLHLVEQIKQYQ